MDALGEVWQADDTPVKQKQAIRQVVSKAVAANDAVKKIVKKKFGSSFVCSVRKLGRPVGSVKIGDEELMKQLNDYSHETSMMHLTLNTPIRTLATSKRRAAKLTGIWGQSQLIKVQGLQIGLCARIHTAGQV